MGSGPLFVEWRRGSSDLRSSVPTERNSDLTPIWIIGRQRRASGPHHIKKQQSCQHRGKTDEAYLAVGKLRETPKGIPPQGRNEKRKHTFDHEHEGKRREQRIAHGRSIS